MWNYVVSAQKPTIVTHSVVGNFTDANDLNLILGKSTRIEIQLLTSEGLQPFLDVGLYGKIESLKLFRPPGENQDLLFICTEQQEFCVLGFNKKKEEIETRAAGSVKDDVARLSPFQIAIIDPECRLIGLHVNEGLFKVIPFGKQEERNKLKEAFNISIEEKQILDMQFLWGFDIPTIALLYKDPKDNIHFKTYKVLLKEKELQEGKIALPNLAGAHKLIPVPFGGILIVGEETITYYDGSTSKTINIEQCLINSYCQVGKDGIKYLLGDHLGKLYGLTLEVSQSAVKDLKIQLLGETTISNTISYLDNSFVFLGSVFGDSQLIRLNNQKDEQGSWVEEIESFTNLGPIVDFCVVDLERQGQGQLVTCSGLDKCGSLRVIRNGIGINEQATIELPGIKGIWSLPSSTQDQFDKYIVLSFVGETRILAMSDDELEETEIPGFESKEQTIYCGHVTENQFIQVTSKSINLVDSSNLELVNKWTPPTNTKINVASANLSQVLVGTGGGRLVYLEISGNSLKEISSAVLEYEISCVNINSLKENSDHSSLCAVGLWTDMSVRLLEVPSLKEITKEKLGGEVIPRSVLLISFEGINYLLCGLGDGHLFTFVLHPANYEFREKRKISLGTQPIVLNTFISENVTHVFASSDQPTVIYSSNKKLLFSNVDLQEVNYVCAFRSESFPDSLAITTNESLMIGSIDKSQKLHIITVPLEETPRRIAFQQYTQTYGVVTIKENQSFLKLFESQTFEVIDQFKLDDFEQATSVLSTSFKGKENFYYVVGTVYIFPNEPEPKKGRILVFEIIDHKLKLVCQQETPGTVYSLKDFNGKLLALVNATVFLYEWNTNTDGSKYLSVECSHKGYILALFVQTRGDFIIIGDLMRSIHLLLYKPEDKKIEEIAKDFDAKWLSAIEVLDDDNYIGADSSHNIFSVQRNNEGTNDEERSKLKVTGHYHLGEFVNRFHHGSLVIKSPDPDSLNLPTIIFGGVTGSIGVIASLPQSMYDFFLKVQENLTKVIRGLGGFSHSTWREYKTERGHVAAKNFLDGDLIESYLDLPPEKMKEVAQGLDLSSEELYKRIETLQRAIH